MRSHPKTDLYLAERKKGLTYREIAAKYGVSHQTVAMACAKHSPGHFKPFNAKQVVYPNLRQWLNDNEVCVSEFTRRLGHIPTGGTHTTVRNWFRGEHFPTKQVIDRILMMTGLTYEELWEVEG